MPIDGDPSSPTAPTAPGGRRAGPPRLLLVGFLLVQVLVPLVLLVTSRSSLLELRPHGDRLTTLKAGWQMYNESSLPHHYRATRRDGATVAIDPTADLGPLRGRALYDPATAAALCDRRPELVRLEWLDRVHECR